MNFYFINDTVSIYPTIIVLVIHYFLFNLENISKWKSTKTKILKNQKSIFTRLNFIVFLLLF